MKIGDLAWCLYHIYLLPKPGIIIDIIDNIDIFYVVLIEGEVHTLAAEDVFLRESEALKYQLTILKEPC